MLLCRLAYLYVIIEHNKYVVKTYFSCYICGEVVDRGWSVNLREWIEREMNAKGWSRRGLSSEADISRGTLDNIFNKPDVLPELDTLAKLSTTFNTPLWRVVEIAGFDAGFKPAKNADRIAQVLVSDPELEEIASMLGDVPAGDRSGVLLYLQLLQARRAASPDAVTPGRSVEK